MDIKIFKIKISIFDFIYGGPKEDRSLYNSLPVTPSV